MITIWLYHLPEPLQTEIKLEPKVKKEKGIKKEQVEEKVKVEKGVNIEPKVEVKEQNVKVEPASLKKKKRRSSMMRMCILLGVFYSVIGPFSEFSF